MPRGWRVHAGSCRMKYRGEVDPIAKRSEVKCKTVSREAGHEHALEVEKKAMKSSHSH